LDALNKDEISLFDVLLGKKEMIQKLVMLHELCWLC